jgi:hypothetical protein
MDKTEEKVLVAGIDVARDRVEISVFRWAQVGHTASHMNFLFKKFGWSRGRSIRPDMPRPWLKQKKGRGAQL